MPYGSAKEAGVSNLTAAKVRRYRLYLRDIMFGLLNINKPRGMTSRDVVNRVQTFVHPAKVGHAGTLDPLATGVLIVCVGPATRLVQYIQRMPKQYEATFLLGRHSDTDDVDGSVVNMADPIRPARQEIEQATVQLLGVIDQRPPTYSALKVCGRRAYELARKGQPVKLKPRQVTIHDIRLIDYDYPRLRLDVRCSVGTYVRSLGRDIAESVGTAAVMSQLRRTAIGHFQIDQACELEALTSHSLQQSLQPAVRAVAGLPSLQLTDEEARRIRNGIAVENRSASTSGEFAACDSHGRLIAILAPLGRDHLRPVRNFV